MSRSRRKTKIFGNTTAKSEKLDKRFANRALRRKVKLTLNEDTEIIPVMREVRSVWSFDKDGKHYYRDAQDEDMRK